MKRVKQISLAFALLSIFFISACERNTDEVSLGIDITFEEASVTSLQSMMQDGELSAVQLVEYYLNRISEVDPQLNSILEINPMLWK